jgi:tetrahydromethanopterin S-methyltransferase subunit B
MKIVSSEPLRVTTLGGTAVLFEAGVPREIAEEIGLLAIQMGAKEYSDKVVEEETAEIAEFEEEIVVQESVQLDEELVTCLEKMMDEGDPKNFKTDGYPKAAAVNKALGRTVDTDAREAAWESILNS